MIEKQPVLNETFTSTGSKLSWHQDALYDLSQGKAHPITAHIMCTDVCNYKCAFCSVGERAGDVLAFPKIMKFVQDLKALGLKSVIISGGGNPILYKCPETGAKFADLIDYLHDIGLEIGLITNGIKLKDYDGRRSYPQLPPEQLDKLTWIRISLAGWEHKDNTCYTPDVDPSKTTLGGSYVFHDIYPEPNHRKHGRVSTPQDVTTPYAVSQVVYGESRIDELTENIGTWVDEHGPEYVRLLPNCLEPSLIKRRCEILQSIADKIDPTRVFVQQKPPRQPKACYKGAVHPVLNCDGNVYSCDSVVLNQDANHQFDRKWAFATWDTIGEVFSKPLEPLAPCNACPGCVFSDQVDYLYEIKNGGPLPFPSPKEPTHVNFI